MIDNQYTLRISSIKKDTEAIRYKLDVMASKSARSGSGGESRVTQKIENESDKISR